jgi:starch-binding outer membrane protein SusE/F
MNKINKLVVALLLGVMGFTACEKADNLASFTGATPSVLSSPTLTVAPTAADSNSISKFVLNWTDPKHAQDPSLYKFVIEIDSADRNFSRAYTRTVVGKLTDSILAKEFNAVMLAWGFEFNKAYTVDVRVTSSYNNNNEKTRSNILKIRATPYKIPPKITLPVNGKLFLVGDASQGGWNNPIPAAFAVAQEFARIDETTFGGIFQLNGGKEYLILPVNNGNWDNKYSIANKGLAGVENGGDFGYNLPDNFKGPATSNLYKITLDFQVGKFTVAPFTQQHGLPSDLWVVGDAFTPGIPAWTNANPMPAGSKFTRRNATEFDITVAMKGGGEYLILPKGLGNWDKYAIENKTANGASSSGKLRPEAPDNFPGPAAAGTYKISVNLFDNSYKVQ